MKIGEIIRTHRKERNLTQEEMARLLGVTASAVNKWENGNTCPDITLLAPIARLLRISLDTLLEFQQKLTWEEMDALVKEMDEKFQWESYEAVFQWAERTLQTYPDCPWLAWCFAMVLEGRRLLADIPDTENYDETILRWFLQGLNSGEEELRYHAADSLFAYYLRKEEYKKAESYLNYFSKENPERKRKQGDIYRKLGRREDAYRTYEELLFSAYQTASLLLQELYLLTIEENDQEKAAILSEKRRDLAELFEMGDYHQAAAGLEIAIVKQNREETLNIMETMLKSVKTMDSFRTSFLYSHMKFKDVNPDFLEEVKNSLKISFRDSETYGFLQGDPRWEQLTGEAKE